MESSFCSCTNTTWQTSN